MITLNKTDFNKLKPKESVMNKAYYHAYSPALSHSDLDMMADIYDKYHERRISRNYSCNVCQMNIIKGAAELYFNTKKSLEEDGK